MARPFVSLLTDFGSRDVSAAICRAVVLGICPAAEVLDLTHEVRKFAIRDGALALWSAVPYLPIGIHVAVIDPGVGTERRPIAIRVGRGDVLIGPDNGLLVPAGQRLGGIGEVRELANPAYRLPIVTATFHGRDIFSPAAAHLALGAAFDTLGPVVERASLVPSPLPPARPVDGGLATEVVYVDTFGNLKLSALVADVRATIGDPVGRRFELRIDDGRSLDLPWARTFGELGAGDGLLYEDAYGRACIAVNRGHAADALELRDGTAIELRAR
jgi:S-adenosyl-L-methionine hydrolase (adenosine-forming)